jgi:hypothetical protein
VLNIRLQPLPQPVQLIHIQAGHGHCSILLHICCGVPPEVLSAFVLTLMNSEGQQSSWINKVQEELRQIRSARRKGGLQQMSDEVL